MFLYGPLLWLRKIVLYLVIIVVGLGLILYFTVNSPLVIKKLADSFAPDYNITYSRIHGNAITGVEIEDLSYNSMPLAKHIALKWNPNGLVKKEILVNKAEVRNANIDGIKAFIASFPSSEENESTEPFAYSVKVKHVIVDVEPFVEEHIMFKSVSVEAKNVYYSSDEIELPTFKLDIDSNISSLSLDASLKEGEVGVKKLSLKEFDTVALETLLMTGNTESNEPQTPEDTTI